ncbi:MAG TPA: T9SS type A sorting domain-containing protein, partial [Terriglobales bacterium]|nr:T9SS type A sorting domain-containing protein [Terriglobales bacterium]
THGANIHDIARDHRDAMVAHSDDGATWTVQNRMNDDPAWFDDWFPEIQATAEGYAYGMWYDWRDATANCGGRSNIYATRSLDGGATWAANQRVTDATTAWTTVASNLIPNEGDYLGMYAGDRLVAFCWADGRNNRPDIYAAKLNQTFTASCAADRQVYPKDAVNVTDQVANASVMFTCGLNYTLTCERNWPGFPMTGSVTVPVSSASNLPFGFAVPDTAAEGFVHLCLNTVLPNGALSSSCCQTLEVLPGIVGVTASLVSASAVGGRVEVVWQLGAGAAAALYRSVDGASWERIGTLSADGLHRMSYVDRDVSGGHRYGYRLGIAMGGAEVTAGETWVDVPLRAVFALHGARPNPAAGAPNLWFSLADGSPATLEVLDLSGRRVFEQQVGSLGAGVHMLALERAHLPAGIYAIRLMQAGHALTGKFAVVR